MIKIVLGFYLVFASPVFANLSRDGKIIQDRIRVECLGEHGALNFRLNRSTQVAIFQNKRALFRAELPLHEPIAALIDEKALQITYDYYFVAEYNLTFSKSVKALQVGDRVVMKLNGDDNDGFMFNDVAFQCSIK